MLTWLADVLRGAGLAVVEIAGWETRGHGDPATILGVLLHHTAGSPVGSYPSLGVVRDGRPGLDGPLANLGLARDGTWYVIAAGVAWHAGAGSIPWCPTDQGNQHLIGVEAESTGVLTAGKADWTPQQLNSYPRGVAALLKYLGLPASRAIAHREWAPSRKIDPVGIDMPAFRTQTAALMTVPPKPPGVLMALTDAEQAELLAGIRALKPGARFDARSVNCRIRNDDQYGHTMNAEAEAADARVNATQALVEVKALRTEVAALRNTLSGLTGGVPVGDPAAFATAVAVELAARLKEK